MSTKTAVWIGMIIGSIVGGYIPMLFGADMLSFTAVLTSSIGAILGVIVGYKLVS